MARTVEVDHYIWIAAPVETVRSQFADLHHHIDANVHPKLRFDVLALEPRRARFTQEVRLLGLRQRDLLERRIDEDGSIHDESIDGFNKGARLDFTFTPGEEAGRAGTNVHIRIQLPTPPLLGFLAPVLRKQVVKEVTEAALEDKRDIESGKYKLSRTSA